MKFGMDNKPQVVGLVGGTGFIGRAVSAALRARGQQVRLVARHAPAQLQPGEAFTAADTQDAVALQQALAGCAVVVYLVAVLAERGQDFDSIIHAGARRTAEAARAAGVGHMVYVSALGASPHSESSYARAKAAAEAAVRMVFPQATVVRPSLVMGEGGGFMRQMDMLTRYAPAVILPGYGYTRFQPVELNMLADMLADACLNAVMYGTTLDAAGPEVLTFRELVTREMVRLGRRRVFVPLPWSLTGLVAYTMAVLDRLTFYRMIPDWLLVTPDQVRLLKQDNVVRGPAV